MVVGGGELADGEKMKTKIVGGKIKRREKQKGKT